MKRCPYSQEREKIIAEAIAPVAAELRLIDAADLIALLRYERHGNLADLVASAAEMFFHPGTINFGAGGDYKLDWNSCPEVTIDLEIRPQGVTVYAQLLLKDNMAGLQINHVAFAEPDQDPNANTAFLARALEEARYHVGMVDAA